MIIDIDNVLEQMCEILDRDSIVSCKIKFASFRDANKFYNTITDEDLLIFTIRADRFLRNMIRAIVGTLVDVGRGRYTVEEFRDILHSRDLSRSSAGAPAVGLFLSDVRYDDGVYAIEQQGDE